MKEHIFILMLVLAAGCSGPDAFEKVPKHLQELENLNVLADVEPAGNVMFSKAQTFGEINLGLLPPQRGYGPDVAVDERGYVYRADKGGRTILVFNDGGELVQNVGREGRGPGEFQSIAAIDLSEGRLVVYDSILSRLSIFSTDNGELLQSLSINAASWKHQVEAVNPYPQTIVALEADLYLTSVIEEKEDGSVYHAYYKMNGKGQFISGKIVETKHSERLTGTTKQGRSAGINLPYSTKGKISVPKDGHIFHINTGEFLIRVYDEDGNDVRSIYYPYEKEPLEKQEVLDEYHPNMHPVFDNAEFPDRWPALESLIIDDEHKIWIYTIVEDKEIRQWYLLENSGEVLASFSWPSDSEIKIIRNNKMYAEETNPETGSKVIVGYDIDYAE